MALKSLLILCQLGLAQALSPGDCAFVGIYGDQDDFALVLMEDAEGEVLSLTEESPSDRFKVSKFAVAKPHVKDAKRGAVLRKADFETDSTSFVAPTALTVFSGPAEAPSALCSITLEAKQGSVTRKLSEEVSVVELGLTETAQYAGSTSGSKAELLEDIANPSNWIRDASRQLSGFSIAKGGNGTMTETTSMKPGNVTMTESTTVEVTESVTETTTAEATRTVVSGCTELGGAVADLVDSKDAVAAFTTAIAGVVDVPEDYVQNVVFTDGSTCGGRRLGARRLQTTGTVTYDLVFPASLGAGAQEAAEAAITALESATAESVSTALTSAMETYSSLADITVTVENVGSLVTSESGGTTPEPTEAPETTEAEEEGPPDAACGAGGLALGLMAMVGHSIF